jgi:hypothetical protein
MDRVRDRARRGGGDFCVSKQALTRGSSSLSGYDSAL